MKITLSNQNMKPLITLVSSLLKKTNAPVTSTAWRQAKQSSSESRKRKCSRRNQGTWSRSRSRRSRWTTKMRRSFRPGIIASCKIILRSNTPLRPRQAPSKARLLLKGRKCQLPNRNNQIKAPGNSLNKCKVWELAGKKSTFHKTWTLNAIARRAKIPRCRTAAAEKRAAQFFEGVNSFIIILFKH